MGRIRFDEIDNYGKGESTSYFALKKDGEVARVRFLYNSAQDIDGEAVHSVYINEKRRNVSCLRAYDEPKEKCPLCASGNKQLVRLYVPIYNESAGEVQIWERGKKFHAQLSSICSRYGRNPIVSQIFEIERQGQPHDQQTSYQIYRTDDPADNTKLEDFTMPEITGTMLLEYSFEQMQNYITTGSFDTGVQRRNSAPVQNNMASEDVPVRRRTPSREEAF